MQRVARGLPPKLHQLATVGLAILVMAAAGIPTPASGARLAFDLRVEAGRGADNTRLIRVKEGDTVTLRCTSDRPLSLHLHGYDLEWKVQPGVTATVSFAARLTGRFPIHAHGAQAQGQGRVDDEALLAYIEVYPR